jgi:uncharacterized protein GlcG (DUF336 family)
VSRRPNTGLDADAALRLEFARGGPITPVPGVRTLAALALVGATAPFPAPAAAQTLASDEVGRILAQAAAEAAGAGLRAHIAVADAEGNLLGLLRMDGAPATSRVEGPAGDGLQGLELPASAVAATKAVTAALLSSGGNAFSTRTASFIVQQNFPPGVELTPGGPLFGVQFSSLPCGDFKRPAAPLGLAGDPGGIPLYRDGAVVGGVGVEGDGVYAVDHDPADHDAAAEERAAVAGARGFEAPEAIRADRILADGIRLPFADAAAVGGAAFAGGEIVPRRGGQPSALADASLGGVRGRVDPLYPIRAGAALSAADVRQILERAAQQSQRTRAAIRQPQGSAARVSIAVVDTDGSLLGFFQTEDAPNFGIDVSLQKARTAAFFSGPGAGDDLRRAGLGIYARDVPLDGSVAFTSRAVGFLAQPYFPPGIPDTDPGPFSLPIGEWSPFNTGLQLDLVADAVLAGARDGCSAAIPRLPNGITIFPGGVPLYRDGRLVGAVGVSGDGVDQDDLIAAAGAQGLEAPPERRSDTLTLRGVRLPWLKFPRHPEL